MARRVLKLSNELELGLSGVSAKEVLERVGKPFDISREVNPRDCIEMKISMARGLEELNDRLREDMLGLSYRVSKMGGRLYGGGIIFADTSSLDPVWLRTTALSEKCSRGFLKIMSQQITMGVNNEYLGLELYNFYRKINPVILAMSASSPFEHKNNSQINDTRFQSSRIAGYRDFLSSFPESMLEAPKLRSKEEYFSAVRGLSSEIKRSVSDGKLDSNFDELTRVRRDKGGEYSYWPFDKLEPHQIFWFIRPRPDFEKGEDKFVIELRIPDAPTRVSDAQMINQFVVGLGYYIAKNGSHSINIPFDGTYQELLNVSMHGMNAEIKGTRIKEMVEYLSKYAIRGIRAEGYPKEAASLDISISNLMSSGNRAEGLKVWAFSDGRKKTTDGIIRHLENELHS